MPQKEETFQVIIDVIKNSTCYKLAFTISDEVLKIYMQQFWYTIKKVSGINPYEFLLANNKCLVDAKVFQKILDICPRFQGVDFTEVLDDEYTLTFLNDIGYKGMFYKENADYPKLIWEDFAFQINHMMEKQRRHENIPYPSRRVNRKKVSIFTDDNFIPETNVSLELGKSISLTKAAEEEAIIVDTMKALKASRKCIRSQSHAEGSSDGNGTKPGVPDESTVTPTTPSDDDENIEYVDTDEEEEKNNDDDDKSIDLEKTDDEETNDEYMHSEEYLQDDDKETDDELVHGDKQVNDDDDEEMTNAEDADTRDGDEEITDAAKEDAEKTEEVKDDIKKVKLPLTSSGLFIPQILRSTLYWMFTFNKRYHKSSLHPYLLYRVSFISHVQLQTTTPIPLLPITTKALPVTIIPDPLHMIIQRVSILEKDVQELKEVDNTITLCASLRFEIPPAINAYLGSSLGDALHKAHAQEALNLSTLWKSALLDWNNPEEYIVHLITIPLPLKGRTGHLTVAAEYFFNNDLEFLKSSDLKKRYTTSIMKTKAARYEIVGIEDMVLTLWSTTKVGYNKDAEK
nr:hypothetical protein [Tanacetum cinerariifolium]